MSSEKRMIWGVVPTNLTLAGVIIAIIMTIASPLVMTFMYGLVWNSTFLEWVWAWPGLIFLLAIGVLNLLVRAITVLLGKRMCLTVADAVLIYIAISASAGFAFSSSFLLGHYAYMVYASPSITDYGKLMPDLWVPKGNMTVAGQTIPVLAPMFNNTAREIMLQDPNWFNIVLGAWLPSLALWMSIFIFLAIAQIGVALMFRKPWIDEEMLPFPYAQMAVEVMRITGFRGVWEHRSVSKIMFIIGLAIGFLVLLPALLASLRLIEVPDIYGSLLVSQYGGYDLSPQVRNNIALMITISPLFIGLAFLLPMDVLITAIAWYVIMYIILPPIEVSLGVVPLTETQDAHTNYFTIGHWYGLMPHMITRGIAIGFPIAWFILAWRHLKRFREDKEVMFGTLMGLIGFLVVWILLSISGVEAPIALMIVIIVLLLYITWMRIRAESTWTTAIYTYGPWWHEFLVLPWLPYRLSGRWYSKEAFAAAASFYPLVTDRTLATVPGPAVMEGFRLAKVAGIRTRNIVLFGLLASILGVIISFTVNLWGMYKYGLFFTVGGQWTGSPDTNFEPNWIDTMVHQNYIQHMSNDHWLWLPQFLAGIVLGFLLVFVRTMFPGIPFNPIGILIGDMPVTGLLMFIPNIIALVVKSIVIRVLGVEGYEKYIVPLMTGMIISSFIMIWLVSVVITT